MYSYGFYFIYREALDHKAPLLRSIEALDKAATGVARYFDRFVNKVTATLGWEQEYFVIDKAMYYARPDLMASGRTVFGRGPAKDNNLKIIILAQFRNECIHLW